MYETRFADTHCTTAPQHLSCCSPTWLCRAPITSPALSDRPISNRRLNVFQRSTHCMGSVLQEAQGAGVQPRWSFLPSLLPGTDSSWLWPRPNQGSATPSNNVQLCCGWISQNHNMIWVGRHLKRSANSNPLLIGRNTFPWPGGFLCC